MLSSVPHQADQLRRPTPRIPTACVVDPQGNDYQGWEKTAEAHGVQLQIVASAEEALRLAHTAPVDLWVINTHLPGLSGYELCSMLKSRSKHAPVYLVTDEYSPSAERAAWAARATLFSVKPVDCEWLANWRRNPSERSPQFELPATS